MKQTLTKDQSARLIELGVEDVRTCIIEEKNAIVFRLEDLLSILPKKITDRRNIYNLYISVNSEDLWYLKYVSNNEYWDSLNSYTDAEELIDAIYDMIVFLKENPNIVWL